MRSVACVLAFFITVIAAVDPLCCPDRCTDGGPTLASHAQGVDCPVCQPSPAIAATPIVSALIVVSERHAIPVGFHSTVTPRQLDPPPRV